MIRRGFLTAIAVLFAVCTKTGAQNIIPRFETIGVNEGLSQSSVYSVYQDREGFMWFGTADGLNRFDGKTIKVYSVRDKNAAYSNFIRGNLSEDKQGRIWFSNETGIFCYDPVSEQINRKFGFDTYHWTEGLLIDSKNVFYLVDPLHGIYAYDISEERLTLTAFRFNASDFLSVFMTTNRCNRIWLINGKTNGIYTFNTDSRELTFRKTRLAAHSVFFPAPGRLCYTTTSGELVLMDTLMHETSAVSFPSNQWKLADVQDIRSDAYHRLWLATLNNGLLCYNELTGKLASYQHHTYQEKSLPINILSAMWIDRGGNLWTGTDGAGVCKVDLKPPRFNLFPANEGDYPQMKDYFVKCFYEDGQKRIWFGTQNSGLNCFEPESGNLKNYTPGKSGNNIVSNIFRDREGHLWVGSNNTLLLADSLMRSFKRIKIAGSPELNKQSAFVYKMIERRNGDLLAATQAGLVLIKKHANEYSGRFCTLKPYTYMLVTDIAEMPDNTIWLASPIRGLIHYRIINDRFEQLGTRFRSVDLRSIHQDELNPRILWISTGAGLARLNTATNEQTIYDERNGMDGRCAYGVLEDDSHNLWVSTNKGIYFFDRKTNVFQNYTVNDGLQSNEFNTQAFYKSRGGTLYFGGIKGFNWFRPGAISQTRSATPGLAITSVNVENHAYVKDTLFIKQHKMVLPYDQNDLAFHFAALDYTRPQANRIRYILQHWDKTWNTAEDQVRYANLPPGKYLLRVKAANSDGIWSAEKQLAIIITAPFWKTGWFYAITGALLLGLIIYVTWLLSRQKIRKKLRELEKQQAINEERDRISRDMHDEIGSGLTHIALLSELIDTHENLAGTVKKDIGNIAVAARKLVENMGEIIWALNPQNDSAGNLLAYTREQMQNYYSSFDFNLSIDFPEIMPEIRLSNEQRRNLYLVTKEGLNNVLKHARATEVELKAVFTDDTLLFEIKDNGIGLNGRAAKTSSNGCKNMQKRMAAISGNIVWASNGCGVTIQYSVQIKNDSGG